MDIEAFWQKLDRTRIGRRKVRVRTPDGKLHTMELRYLKPPKPPKLSVRLAMEAAQPPSPDNLRCQRCGLCAHTEARFLPEREQGKGKILVVLANPLPDDLVFQYLKREVLRPAGLTPADVDFLSSVKCQPIPDGNKGKHGSVEQIRMCRPFLLQDIFSRKPNKVIAFGEHAAHAISADPGTALIHRISRVYWLTHGFWTVPYIVTYSPDACVVGGSIGRGFAQLVRKHVDWFVNEKMHRVEFPELEVRTRWAL